MRDLTPEEKELIVNTEITPDCFEKWEDYHYEEIELEHFPHPHIEGKFCTIALYPTSYFESMARDCEVVRRKYLQTKNEHYFDILVRLLPNSYKVVNLCAERKDICKAKHRVQETLYQRYCEQKLPEDFQERAEGFASMSDTVQEEMFRAGFYCGLNINDVFTDPDRPVLDNGYILVRKEDLNLDWYKKTKARRKKMKYTVESEEEFYMQFKKNLKKELKFRGIGYKRIAPDIGMNFGSFTNKMSTYGPTLHKFTLFEAKKIADYLNMSVDDLIEG